MRHTVKTIRVYPDGKREVINETDMYDITAKDTFETVTTPEILTDDNITSEGQNLTIAQLKLVLRTAKYDSRLQILFYLSPANWSHEDCEAWLTENHINYQTP